MATITTPDAVPGEIIEAAWGDAVRTDLTNVNAEAMARVLRAGDNSIGTLLIGKAASGAGSPGIELHTYGGATYSWDTQNGAVQVSHLTAADGDGSPYVTFYRYTANLVGSINQQSFTGVTYNTASDKRLKTLTRPVDPDEALDKIAATEPVNFVFIADPAAGEQIGFFAQDLYPIAPEMVAPGRGQPDDDDFVPWMVDHSKLVPTLVAAVQALTSRVKALEEAATP